MEQDVGWLLDRARIVELTARYNRCFDDGDPEGFADTFTEDGVMEVAGGPSTSGRHDLAEMCRKIPWGIMHVTVDATVEVNGTGQSRHVALVVIGRAARREDKPTLIEHRPLRGRPRPHPRRLAIRQAPVHPRRLERTVSLADRPPEGDGRGLPRRARLPDRRRR